MWITGERVLLILSFVVDIMYIIIVVGIELVIIKYY